MLNNAPRVLLVFGTRPEAIKMAPVVQAVRRSLQFEPIVCSTGQHREMLAQVLDYFELQADISLDVMQPGQTLTGLTTRCLEGLDRVVSDTRPDYVVAQGDTTTVMAASLISVYHRVKFVHVEAGLRSGDLWSPWPEEANRRIASATAWLHCAPTNVSRQNLLDEGIDDSKILVSGNTVIDALLQTVARERNRAEVWQTKHPYIDGRKVVLITGHRRENFGQGFASICKSIQILANQFPNVAFVYPVHLNPRVRKPVFETLGGLPNVHLIEPAAYPEFVWLMDRADILLTDSGGVQEEAPSLGKPILVMRDNTERPEAVAAGAAELVGTRAESIIHSVTELLVNAEEYRRRQVVANPYGDGRAAEKIVDALLKDCRLEDEDSRQIAPNHLVTVQ